MQSCVILSPRFVVVVGGGGGGFLSDGDIVNASVRSSRYLLIHFWAEFKQTCYVTSPYGKGV